MYISVVCMYIYDYICIYTVVYIYTLYVYIYTIYIYIHYVYIYT
jgi:hypothetical protein